MKNAVAFQLRLPFDAAYANDIENGVEATQVAVFDSPVSCLRVGG